MKKREDRRDRTWRVSKKAQAHHLKTNHPDGVLDCVCERSVWFFDKVGIQRHNCSKKTHGSPKIGRGICHAYDIRPTVLIRVEWRRYSYDLSRAINVEDVSPEIKYPKRFFKSRRTKYNYLKGSY